MKKRDQDNTYTVIFRDDNDYRFPLYQTNDLVLIKGYSHDYFTVIETEVVNVLEVFSILSFGKMLELGHRDEWDKIIDQYLHKFDFFRHLGLGCFLYIMLIIIFILEERMAPMNATKWKARCCTPKFSLSCFPRFFLYGWTQAFD